MQRIVGLFNSGMAFVSQQDCENIMPAAAAEPKFSTGSFWYTSTRMPETSETRRNFVPWAALVFAILSLAFNILLFVGSPQQAALPWLSILLAVVALLFLGIGMVRALGQRKAFRVGVLGVVIALFVLIIVSLTGFASLRSRELPGAALAPQVGQPVPDFTLADTSGKPVSLRQLLETSSNSQAPAPKAVLLVFYRGYW